LQRKTTAVFVHGVPDTYRIWDRTRENLKSGTSVALALPGFDAPLPLGFQSSKEDYVDWIIQQIEAAGQPVDLVGHDWGAMFALRVASLRPDLVRTLAAGNGPLSPNYEFHQLAKVWQTPGDGEAFMRDLDSEKMSGLLQGLGVDANDAAATAAKLDDAMKQSILQLYRSAIHVGEEWEPGLSKISCPTLIYWGREDMECPVRYAYSMAEHIKFAQVIEFDCKHWVPLHKPETLAGLLENLWGK
jgi:pimeloyl-ACP methyl ester carboxylesterase